MVKWTVVAILLLPVAEIATFVLAAALIGFGWAFALMVATSVWGCLVLQRAGRGRSSCAASADSSAAKASSACGRNASVGVLGAVVPVVGATDAVMAKPPPARPVRICCPHCTTPLTIQSDLGKLDRASQLSVVGSTFGT